MARSNSITSPKNGSVGLAAETVPREGISTLTTKCLPRPVVIAFLAEGRPFRTLNRDAERWLEDAMGGLLLMFRAKDRKSFNGSDERISSLVSIRVAPQCQCKFAQPVYRFPIPWWHTGIVYVTGIGIKMRTFGIPVNRTGDIP
jgi:hypothetical protein